MGGSAAAEKERPILFSVPNGDLDLARVIASGAPVAMRYTKETVLKGMDMTLEQGLRLETDLSMILQTTRDRAEGLRSFAEKREPKFTGS